MSLYPEAKRLADELVAHTGESLTAAVITALRERLAHTPPTRRKIEERRAHLREIVEGGSVAKSRGEMGTRIDEDLYDESGLPG